MDLIIHMLLLGLAIMIISRSLPGIHIASYWTAIVVAVVYSLIDVILGTVLKFIGVPFIFITLGFFLLLDEPPNTVAELLCRRFEEQRRTRKL